MEHRWKKRCIVSMNVVVCFQQGQEVPGVVRDMSGDGMFIEVRPWPGLVNSGVVIELPGSGTLHGWVVRIDDEGIGIMFRVLDQGERQLLTQLIDEKMSA